MMWIITYICATSHSYKLWHFVFSSPHEVVCILFRSIIIIFFDCASCVIHDVVNVVRLSNMLSHVFLITASCDSIRIACDSNRVAFLTDLDNVTIDPSLSIIPSSHIIMMESVISLLRLFRQMYWAHCVVSVLTEYPDCNATSKCDFSFSNSTPIICLRKLQHDVDDNTSCLQIPSEITYTHQHLRPFR